MTQGNTHIDGDEKCCTASFATDRDLSTRAATKTADGAGWLKLHFDNSHFIHKIIIYNMFYTNWYTDSNNWCTSSETNFEECLTFQNNVQVSVYMGEKRTKSCGILQLAINGLDQSDQIYNFICNAKGSMVKLSKDDASTLSIFELVVISTGAYEKISPFEKISPLHSSEFILDVQFF